MRLEEMLKQIPPTAIVHIGTENGSGWIAVDTVENVAKHMQEINYHLYLIAKTRQRVHEERFETAHAEMSKLAEEIRTGNLSMKIEVANAGIRKRREIIEKTLDAMRELDFKNWKPVQKREVVDWYRKKADYDGICILVTGTDKGNIWWYKEKPNIWEEQEVDKK